MSPDLKTAILAIPLVTALGVSLAFAQTDKVVLVTPEGEVLNYVPDAGDVIVKRNRRGERVLIDHYGNIVATEVSARRYAHQRTENEGADYFPSRPRKRGEIENVTGSLPEMSKAEPQDSFEEQPLPSDGIQGGNASGNDDGRDNAALDADQPALSGQRPNPDPEIKLQGKKSKFEITALQVFLDREGASPGVIDGKMGLNVSKAIRAYDQISGEQLDPNDSDDILTRLGVDGGMPIMTYTITSADAAGPYVASVPEDYSLKAALPSLAFTSVTEALAERFHMDENYLKELNPGVDFTIPGTHVKVINPGALRKGHVARIVADKARKQVFAYDADGALISAYPASIGSSDTPSPSGIHTVKRVAFNPNYTYNPKINFLQGKNTKVLTIPPGPNGPVGTVWIALDKPTYGIHGTPDPSRIGRTQSHGCIRLTNWDATELAKMVKPGVTVEFID